jgi:hypothetical protein
MSLYAYAIVDSAGPVRPFPGLFAMPVYNVPFRQTGVVVSDLPAHVPAPARSGPLGAERALEHSSVTDRLMNELTVLPVRFGTVMKDQAEVMQLAEEHFADFQWNLERLRNRVEFGLRVIWSGDAVRRQLSEKRRAVRAVADDTDTLSPGSFMQARLADYRLDQEFALRADREIAAIDRVCQPFAVEKQYERLKTRNLLLSACLLVEKSRQDELRDAYRELRSARPDFKFLLSGPWPAYNFVRLSPDRNRERMAR